MSQDIDRLEQLYPHIAFRRTWSLSQDTTYALGQCEALVAALVGAPLLPGVNSELLRVSLKKGAQATTAIEGNTLSSEEIDRIVDGQSLPADQGYQEREVRNVLDALNLLLKELAVDNHDERITPQLLLRFHDMIGAGLDGRFRATPGAFATASRVVGPYRAPRHEDVVPLVNALCDWLPGEFHYPNQSFQDTVVQAIVTHLYIEWIHPFDDGNGRTGRLVEFYLLLRGGLPNITSHLLVNHYNETRSEYYRHLQRAHDTRNPTDFIAYAVNGLLAGLRRTLALVRTNLLTQMWRVLVYDTFRNVTVKQRGTFNRQRNVALALPLDRPITYTDVPKLSDELQRAYAESSSTSTLLRDLQVLEDLKLIRRTPGLIEANRALLEGTLPVRRSAAHMWIATTPR
jgi:Fic family protein